MRVLGEVRGHPVEQHPDPVLVQVVDQVHQVLRLAVAGRGREVAGRLVAPRAEERVLHHRQQLDVGEAEVLHVVGQLVGQLAVGEPAVALLGPSPPRADVHLVHGLGRRQRVAAAALGHPLRVAPLVGQVPDHGAGLRGLLGAQRERVGLLAVEAVRPLDGVLVQRALPDVGGEALPDAGGAARREHRLAAVPAVPVADHRDGLGVRGPHREHGAGLAVDRSRMGAEPVLQRAVRALVEQEEVVVGQVREGARLLAGGLGCGGARLGHGVPPSLPGVGHVNPGDQCFLSRSWVIPRAGMRIQSGRLLAS